MTGINAFGGKEKEATYILIQDAVFNECIKLGIKREIMLTAKGLQW
jgi:hypothetical protein